MTNLVSDEAKEKIMKKRYSAYDKEMRGKPVPATITEVSNREIRFIETSNGWWDVKENRPATQSDLSQHEIWRLVNGGTYNEIAGLVHTSPGQINLNLWVEITRNGRGTRHYELPEYATKERKAHWWRLMRKLQDLLIMRTAGIDVRLERSQP